MGRIGTIALTAVVAALTAVAAMVLVGDGGAGAGKAAAQNSGSPSNAQLQRLQKATDRRVIAALKRVNRANRQTVANRASIAGLSSAQGVQGPQGPQGPPGLSTGPAGGALAGSFPNPGIADGAVGPDALGAVPAVSLFSMNNEILSAATPLSLGLTDMGGGFDVGDMFDPATPTVATAPRDGIYHLTGYATFQANSQESLRTLRAKVTEPGATPVRRILAQLAPTNNQSLRIGGSWLFSVPAGTTFEIEVESAESGVASVGGMVVHHVGPRG